MTNDVKLNSPTIKTKKKKIASLERRKARAGWLFILPFLIAFAIIYIPMLWSSLSVSFYETQFVAGIGNQEVFIGFKNYTDAFLVDKDFTQTLVEGLGQMAFDIPAILIFSLFMAVMLNQKMAGRAAFRAIFFLPVILSTGFFAGIEAYGGSIEGEEDSIDTGEEESTTDQLVSSMDLQILFSSMKVGSGLVEYVTEAINNIYDIVNRAGVQMLIFLAALQSISPAIYEACRIDGATSWETFWKITFPMISPMILVNGVYTIIDAFTAESNTIMSYISTVFTNDEEMSTAMSWIYFGIVILVVALIASILSAFVFYGRKND